MNEALVMDLVSLAEPELPLTALDRAFARYLQQAQPSEDVRHTWLAALTSHQFGRGHACLDLDLLRQNGVLALGWDARWQATLPPDLADAANSLPWCQGEASPLVLDGERLYLRRNWLAEQAIRSSILARLALPCVVPEGLAQALDSLFERGPAATADASTAPDWQKVACALAARGRFTLITGGPGTGKTTTVVRLLALLQSQASRPLRIALAAPTGKAAARLGESISQAIQRLPLAMQAHIPTQAQTLHKLLQVRAAVLASAAPQLALDVVVVDEASMIDLELMARLMAAVPLSASLILLGDKDQLASVEAGAVMGQLCAGAQAGGYSAETEQWLQRHTGQDVSPWAGAGSALAQQTVMLRHSHRFASNSLIGQWASAVNAGDRQAVAALWEATPRWSNTQEASVTRLQPAPGSDAGLAALVLAAWQPTLASLLALQAESKVCDDEQALLLLKALGRFQVLCALREGPAGVLALNRSLARALAFPLEGWYPGRPVMVTRNDYNLGLMNGDVGLCLPSTRGLRVAFAAAGPDGVIGVRWVLPSRLDAIETVLAMTVHKSQGSEFDQVALVLPERMTPVLTRELLYTGITRAKSQLTLVVPQAGVLRQAVAVKILRSGGLSMEAKT
ncbi:exodeoxyribonuclease V subunit alpha [Rhodoferax sp. U11-2br]|uniref:exodeoxyribonuclease V subunit alpha n=1 Tax=Rhodoferax sp. U11-2br TaxID=2838878 RepID=UPI001BEA1FE2|nr:exodeoxyribonuclease V subunit alpha [Rhodoferax sp. U11-2br]MBT3068891.1 exodeoxyribonuclease V subunit alpha [Rhodoferax sp. U11-2br]